MRMDYLIVKFIILYDLVSVNSLLKIFNDDDTNLRKRYINFFQNKLKNLSLDFSTDCLKSVDLITDNNNDEYFESKVYTFSGKNIDDLGSYYECISNNTNDSLINNFFVYKIDKENDTVCNIPGSYFFGVCIALNCNETEMIRLFINASQIIQKNYFQQEQIKVYKVKESNDSITNISNIYLLIPLIIYLFLLLISIFPSLLICFFCFFISKTDTDRTSNINDVDSNIIIREIAYSGGRFNYDRWNNLKSCFNINTNWEEIFTEKSSFDNNSGLNFIKGIRSMSMIFIFIGTVYRILITSPMKIYSKGLCFDQMSSYFYSIINIGLRISPRILFSLSGYILTYKVYCFLENEIENIKLDESHENVKLKIENAINFKLFMKFFSYQIYKFLYYLLAVFLIKFSFYYTISIISSPGPFWAIIKSSYFSHEITSLIMQIFLLDNLEYSNDNFLSFSLWIARNEIIFFIITTVIIFIFFKKQYRFDIFLVISIFCIFLVKVGFFFYIFFLIKQKFYHSDMLDLKNISFFKSPYYNYQFFLIGCLFGLVNYVFQKQITFQTIKETHKYYLRIPFYFVKFIEEIKIRNFILLYIFCVSFFIFDASSMTIFINFFQQSSDSEHYKTNFVLGLFFVIDQDIFVILFFIFFTGLFIRGQINTIQFLNHKIWNILSRSYFTFILSFHSIIIYLLYNSESRFKFHNFNIFFLSSFSLVIQIIWLNVNSLMIEAPFRKLNKFLLKN